MFGVYNMERDTLAGDFQSAKNWITFLGFLAMVRAHYRNSDVLHVVLDNASYHLKVEVRDYARSHGIKFYWTPTNASRLNHIESQFTAMKKFSLDNTDYRSHKEQEVAINQYLTWRNRTREISMRAWRTQKREDKKAA